MTTEQVLLAGLGWLAFGVWVVTFARCWHPGRTRHMVLPPDTQHAAIITVLVAVGGGTLAAMFDILTDRGTGDLIRGMLRSSVLVAGIYGLLGTRV